MPIFVLFPVKRANKYHICLSLVQKFNFSWCKVPKFWLIFTKILTKWRSGRASFTDSVPFREIQTPRSGKYSQGFHQSLKTLLRMKIHYVMLKKDAQYFGRTPKISGLGVLQTPNNLKQIWDPGHKSVHEKSWDFRIGLENCFY